MIGNICNGTQTYIYSQADIARLIGRSPGAIQKAIIRGVIPEPTVPHGRRLFFSEAAKDAIVKTYSDVRCSCSHCMHCRSKEAHAVA